MWIREVICYVKEPGSKQSKKLPVVFDAHKVKDIDAFVRKVLKEAEVHYHPDEKWHFQTLMGKQITEKMDVVRSKDDIFVLVPLLNLVPPSTNGQHPPDQQKTSRSAPTPTPAGKLPKPTMRAQSDPVNNNRPMFRTKSESPVRRKYLDSENRTQLDDSFRRVRTPVQRKHSMDSQHQR